MPTEQLNIFKEFAKVAETYYAKPAIIFDVDQSSEQLTYSRLYKQSVQASHWLKSQGIVSGDKVVLLLENRPEYVFCFLGIINAGAVAVPLDAQFPPDQIARIVEHSEARLILTNEKLCETLKGSLKKVSLVAVDTHQFREDLLKSPEHSTDPSLSFDDTLATLFI